MHTEINNNMCDQLAGSILVLGSKLEKWRGSIQ